MNLATTVLAALGIIAALGATAAYFRRSSGNETIRLLQINIQAFRDDIADKDRRIAYLEGQLVIKDETIKRLLKK